jgi:hypothetical protein
METFLQPTSDHASAMTLYVLAPMFVMYILSTVADLFNTGKQMALACSMQEDKHEDYFKSKNSSRHSRIKRTGT